MLAIVMTFDETNKQTYGNELKMVSDLIESIPFCLARKGVARLAENVGADKEYCTTTF